MWIRHQHNHHEHNHPKALHTHYIILPLLPSSLKQVQEVQDSDPFQSCYSQSNHHKWDSHTTKSKLYSLIESQLLICTPAHSHKFHALTFHPYLAFTTPLAGSAFRIQSEVCGEALLKKKSMCLGQWLFLQRNSIVDVWQFCLKRFPPPGLHKGNSSCLLILLIQTNHEYNKM